jgi:N-formylglutamate deformylase
MDLPLPDAPRVDLDKQAASLRGPFTIQQPRRQTAPLVFVSAHSGADYSPAFLRDSRLDPLTLRRSEDSFVDQLFAAAPGCGAPLLVASFPRAFCDANREKWELDPSMFDEALPDWVNTSSPRVHAGLGTIARVVASGEAIYRGKLAFAEAVARVQTCWQPFHDALAALVEATLARFNACLVVDCHSMPAVGGPLAATDIVLGDAHGTACAGAVTRAVERGLTDLGFVVRRNDPYAGGYITRHYGRPRAGVHALQIEISRSLYMDEARMEKRPGFERMRGHTARFIERLAAEIDPLLPRP